MRFVVDENIGRAIVDYLRSNKHEVQWIKEVAPGISDRAILTLALQHECVIITYDQDFGELVFAHNERHAGVILLRLPSRMVGYHVQALQQFLKSQDESNIIGKFWKVDERHLL